MEQLQRVATPQYARLDRAFQAVARPADYLGQKGTIRAVAGTNMTPEGLLHTNVGTKTQDDVFTVIIEIPRAPRGTQVMRLTFHGSYAEEAVRQKLVKGCQIQFDAHVGGKLDEFGRLTRMPHAHATWFEVTSSVKTTLDIPGVEEVK